MPSPSTPPTREEIDPRLVESAKRVARTFAGMLRQGMAERGVSKTVALDAADTIDTLLSALSAAEGAVQREQWQPIDTAPRHGEVLLWWRSCLSPSVGRWDDMDEDGSGRIGWRSAGDQCVPINQQDCTHWMPLPAPPTSSILATPGAGE